MIEMTPLQTLGSIIFSILFVFLLFGLVKVLADFLWWLTHEDEE